MASSGSVWCWCLARVTMRSINLVGEFRGPKPSGVESSHCVVVSASGYDRVWSSNLALTQGRCFRWLRVQPYCLIKARLRRGRGYPPRLRRGRGYPPCVPAVGDIQWQRPLSRRPEES